MFKKIAIAGLAMGIGLLLLSKVSLVKVMWKDSKEWVSRQVPPEVKLKEIKAEVDKIDGEIKQNLSNLAKMEVDTKMLDEEVVALRDRQQKLRADISTMNQSLDGRTAKVSFQGHDYRISDLTRKLDMAVVDYKNVKERLKSKESLLAEKKQGLEAAHNCITTMRNQKEELRTQVARLATQIEVLKQKQVESHISVNDSQISRCQELIKELDVRLRVDMEEARLLGEHGYTNKLEPIHEAKTTDEVRKEARQVLADEEDHAVVENNK